MIRLDQALVERGLCESREKARRLVVAGQVRINAQSARKPSDQIKPDDVVTVDTPEKYVSRGGHKLEHALIHFRLDVREQVALDLGASTGGFTDCLLQHGVARIFAVDVGQGQLAWKLRRDSRVVVMEKTNARHLETGHMPAGFSAADLAVIDCSFISLKKILPPAVALLKPDGKIVALIKPQFEAGKAEVDKGRGVITDATVHDRVLDELKTFVAAQRGLIWHGVIESPLLGPAGNKEFLVLIEKQADKIRRIGLIGNLEKADCAHILRKAAKLVERAGRKVFCDAQTARLAGFRRNVRPDTETLADDVDLLLVFGGDGTILRTAREIAGVRTPMLGVNIGGLGFLTGVPSDKLATALKLVWRGEFKYESRALIEATGQCHGRIIRETALNDIVIGRGAVPRLIPLEVSVDGEPVTRYRCDGLIISSPTGSTAYSLAAGGPIVLPTAEVFCLTPISPHSLSNRSIILPLSSAIRIKAVSPLPATILSADGQAMAAMDAGDEVTIRRSRRSVRLIQLAEGSFLEALRRKLHWRGTYL